MSFPKWKANQDTVQQVQSSRLLPSKAYLLATFDDVLTRKKVGSRIGRVQRSSKAEDLPIFFTGNAE